MAEMRTPDVRAYVIDKSGTEYDVSDELMSFSMSKSDEENADSIEVKFANKDGKYDKFASPRLVPKEVMKIKHSTTVWALDVDRDSSKVLTGTFGGTLYEWGISLGQKAFERGSDDSVYSVQYSSGETHAVISRYTEETIVISLQDNEIVYLSDRLHGKLRCAAISPDDRLVGEVGDNFAYIWESGLNETTGGANEVEIPIATGTAIMFSPNNKYVAFGSSNTELKVYEISSGNIYTHNIAGKALGMDFSADSSTLIVATNQGEIVSLQPKNTGSASVLYSDPDYIDFNSVQYSHDESMMVIAGNVNNPAKTPTFVVDMVGSIISTFDGHTSTECKAAMFSHDDKNVISVGTDGYLRMWNVHTAGYIDNSMFQENRKLRLEERDISGTTDIGTFVIRRVKPGKVSLGAEETLNVSCFDKSKNLLNARITTDMYEDVQMTAIAADILQTYADYTVDDFDFPNLDYHVARVQFIDEYIWDALLMLFQTKGYTLGFNRQGVLVAYPGIDPDNWTVAKTLNESEPISWYQPEWNDDDLKNTVKVIGRDLNIGETVLLPEEQLFTATERLSSGDHRRVRKYYYFDDHAREAHNVRIEWKGLEETWDTSDYVKIRNMTKHWIKVEYHNENHKTTDADFQLACYGQPLGQKLPSPIIKVVDDDVLVREYGVRELEISNPLLDSEAKVAEIANRELTKSLWTRNQISFEVAYDNDIDVGDVIKIWHHKYKKYLTLYVNSFDLDYTEGSKYTSTFHSYIIEY